MELAALSDPALLAQQVLSALGARGEPGFTAAESLLDLLRNRSLLLVLDNCEHLVDAIVLRQVSVEEARYRLLETVRQYGLERLAQAGEVEGMRRRHAEFFLALAETSEPLLLGGMRDPVQMAKLEHDGGNLRVLAEWAGERPERVEIALRLGSVLHWFWFARGPAPRRAGSGWPRPWSAPRGAAAAARPRPRGLQPRDPLAGRPRGRPSGCAPRCRGWRRRAALACTGPDAVPAARPRSVSSR